MFLKSYRILRSVGLIQALYDAKNRQIETEDHLKQIAEREAGRLVLEAKRIGAEMNDTTEYVLLFHVVEYVTS